MRAVIQRVNEASVSVEGEIKGAISRGLLVFLGVGKEDTIEDVKWLVSKIVQMRIFEDEDSKMNLSIEDIGGEVLVISQFTLFGNMRKGTRPSFNNAALPEKAEKLYEEFIRILEEVLLRPVQKGVFAAYMNIKAHNDGPVTMVLDSSNKGF